MQKLHLLMAILLSLTFDGFKQKKILYNKIQLLLSVKRLKLEEKTHRGEKKGIES